MEVIVLDVLREGAPSPLSFRSEKEFLRRGTRIRRAGYLARDLVLGLDKAYLSLIAFVPKSNDNIEIGNTFTINPETTEVWVKIGYDELTSVAKSELEKAIEKLIKDEEKKFVEFFNKSDAITTRLHSLELLPGIGKTHMWEIIHERKRKPFETLAELKERIPLLPDPVKMLKERILKEIQGGEKYYLFVRPPRRRP